MNTQPHQLSTSELKQLSKQKLIQIILQLSKSICDFHQNNKKLEQYNQKLEQKIKELENQLKKLNKDSNTSSKPPSQDIHKQNKKNQSLRKKSDKKTGGQNGHQGTNRAQVNNPDEIIKCEPKQCSKCGESLHNQHGIISEKRQERDIPPINVTITEYQQIKKQCKCGCINRGKFPNHIKSYVQIGDNAQAFLIYLNIAQLIPFKRLKNIADDLFGFPISEGSIDNILNRAEKRGNPLHKMIMNIVKSGKWVGSDETGIRIEGHRDWLWTWQNKLASYYAIEVSRGYQVPAKHFGEDYKGVLNHDCWSAQNNTKAKQGHQQCHPHLQRFLKFLIEVYNSKWAYELYKLLYKSQQAQKKIWQKDFDKKIREQVILGYKQQLKTFLNQSLQEKEEITLQKRFCKHQDSIFRFLYDPDIPFHNNDSEKAIRNAKVKQKISGGFRSRKGADRYAVLLSIVETAKKQEFNLLDSIRALLCGRLVFGGC